MKKLLLFTIVLSIFVMAFAPFAYAAAAKRAASASSSSSSGSANVTSQNVGLVDRTEILNNYAKFNQARQQLANISRQKADEASAAADKETDPAKKAQALQSKRMELAQEEQRIMAPIYRDCEQAVREVAAKKNILLVFDKAFVLIGGIDITQDVIQQLARNK